MLRRHVLILLSVALLGLIGASRWVLNDPQPLVRTALIMGTLVEIRAYPSAAGDTAEAVEAAFAEMRRVDKLLSSYEPESEISQLSASSKGLELSAETVALLRQGQQLARLTQGAFALTLGRVKQLWGIAGDNPRVPDPAELRAALQGSGPEALSISGRRVTKADPWLQFDLGGIAKGYAVDRAVAVLRRAGISSAAVNAGGDIRLLGRREGRPWRIGIQHPRRSDAILLRLNLSDRAVVTSGDYERYFEQDGVRYHHIFSPEDGRPARLCRSVTVVAEQAVQADALATAAFVLGPERGLRLLEDLPGVEGLLVDSAGQLVKTSGLPE
jgi:thiamine biosynthesis lipoprotein